MSLRPLGIITDYTAIKAAGETLAELLKTEMENPVQISIASPGEDYGAPVNEDGEEVGISRVNLFLYRVEESVYAKNNDWVDMGGGKQIPYPLTLNLYYMLNIFTPDKTSNLDEHLILGDVMRVFHANQIIDPIYYEGTLDPNEPPLGLPWEELKIIQHPLPLQELAAVWHAINHPYRLSVAYEVSVVQIAPPENKGRRVRRVDSTHVKAVTMSGPPMIGLMTPGRCYAGDLVTIIGEHFVSDFLKMYLNEQLIAPHSTSATELTFHVPDGLPPGLYAVKICNEEGCSEEKALEELSPFLYRIDPQMKYVEDPDFPKEGTKPVLTLWGGNFSAVPTQELTILATPEGKPALGPFEVPPERIKQHAVIWALGSNLSDMQAGRTIIEVKLNGARKSNSLSLEFPKPRIYKVTPETITDLSREIVIEGDNFRSGNTKVLLHSLSDDTDTELAPLSVKNSNEVRIVLPALTAAGAYQVTVRVYSYDSQPHEIMVGD
jgi:hypothetical protein